MNGDIRIARYLAARGRRDEAIARLAASSDDQAMRELDKLDAVDALGECAKHTTSYWGVAAIGRALGRCRRFDLLRPLVVHPPAVQTALAGLWRAAPTAEDALLVRDVLLPSTTTPWDRSACAQMLALLGDVAMAKVIISELEAALASVGKDGDKIDLYCAIATAAVAAGEPGAEAAHGAAHSVWHGIFGDDDDMDGYGIPSLDGIRYARATMTHLSRLVIDRHLPWRPETPVSVRFMRDDTFSRYGANREQHEEFANRIIDCIERGDMAGVRATYEASLPYEKIAPYILAEIARTLPSIDDVMAHELARYALSSNDATICEVVIALAEAGHHTLALSLVPRVENPYSRHRVHAVVGAHTRDMAMLDEALAFEVQSDERELAVFARADR